MDTFWVILYRHGGRSWNIFGTYEMSKALTESELRRLVENDRKGYEWAMAESCLIAAVKKEVVFVEPNPRQINPILNAPPPAPEVDFLDEENEFDHDDDLEF